MVEVARLACPTARRVFRAPTAIFVRVPTLSTEVHALFVTATSSMMELTASIVMGNAPVAAVLRLAPGVWPQESFNQASAFFLVQVLSSTIQSPMLASLVLPIAKAALRPLLVVLAIQDSSGLQVVISACSALRPSTSIPPTDVWAATPPAPLATEVPTTIV